MAVKQNNTEGNGTPGASGTGKSTSQSSSSATTQKGMNPGSSSSNSTTGCSSAPNSNNSGSGKVSNETPDLSSILEIISIITAEQSRGNCNYDISRLNGELIRALARVPNPKSKEDLKRFKEDIVKIGEFFAKVNEEHQPSRTHHYLHIVYKLITAEEPPSCAIAIVFQLFTKDMVHEAVQTLLSNNLPDSTIRKTVKLLYEWKMMNFCQNLNLWILAIWSGLKDQGKFDLLNEIALENIEKIFPTLMIPVLRPMMMHIVFPILEPTKNKPDVFHKVVLWIPRVVNELKKQAAQEKYSDDTRKCLQMLVDLTSALMATFPGYDELYKPVVEALSEFSPSFDYVNAHRANSRLFENNRSMMNSNAKVGLVNLGNTCYMNSVLQALAMTKEFSRGILLSGSKSPLLIKIQELIALMLHSTRFELTPSRVLDATRPPGFTHGLQQDSSEFLGYLLDTLHEQELAHRSPSTITSKIDTKITTDQDDQDVVQAEDEAASSTPQQTKQQQQQTSTTIEKTFMGKLATTYKCLTCSWQSTNIDSFRDLQLSFPEVKNDCASNYTVQDLIDYYCSSEKLHGDNQYFCERCKKLSDAERFINVISAPKNLILTLKHFKYDQSNHMRAKLMHKVFHNENVSVKVCSAETLAEIASVHYDLYAGVVHSGCSMDSGHYYTYASDGNNKWYKFNDDVVNQCKIAELNNLTPPNTPYILFYQMGGRESPTASSTMIKIESPPSLKLEELSPELRDYVDRDNFMFGKELKNRRAKLAQSQTSALFSNRIHRRGDGPDDDEDEQPPPSSGCGDNALNINVNRFVF
ncbi:ubiquitin carboxyl-terminal hydrolase 35 [Eupeodes corollae]|uniref:ubiquitin carboxyl-terminal hydrolase 35 n=1 Tax=Eupeodes corollae TaxID=290404 RepID=UPI0024921D93|nr:ubiquitin carboxyl-terminal hydrolase 35 [Eupeodes corollae]